jgi:hypothetical protein
MDPSVIWPTPKLWSIVHKCSRAADRCFPWHIPLTPDSNLRFSRRLYSYLLVQSNCKGEGVRLHRFLEIGLLQYYLIISPSIYRRYLSIPRHHSESHSLHTYIRKYMSFRRSTNTVIQQLNMKLVRKKHITHKQHNTNKQIWRSWVRASQIYFQV